MPHIVTLSRSEGSIWMGVEMLRCAQHDRAVPSCCTLARLPPLVVTRVASPACHPERREGSVGFPWFSPVPLSPRVTLSTFATLRVNSAKGLARGASRCFAALSMTERYLPATLRLRLMPIGHPCGCRKIHKPREYPPTPFYATIASTAPPISSR